MIMLWIVFIDEWVEQNYSIVNRLELNIRALSDDFYRAFLGENPVFLYLLSMSRNRLLLYYKNPKNDGCSLPLCNAYFGFQLKNEPFDGRGPFGNNVSKSPARHISNQISRLCNGLLIEINKRWSRSCPPEVTEQDMSHEIKIFSIFQRGIKFRSFAIKANVMPIKV